MAFIYVADGIDDVLAAHLNQYADAWTGVSGKGQPFNAVAVNDPINFAISARNLDPTNSRAAQFLKADGTVLFQVDAAGVKVSPDGTVASVPATLTATQTLTNKTLGAGTVLSATGIVATAQLAPNAVTQRFITVGSTSGPTTVSTALVDLQEMVVNLTTVGGDIEAYFVTAVNNSGGSPNGVSIALKLDAAAAVGTMTTTSFAAGASIILVTFYLWTGVAAGAHTVKGQFAAANAGTATAVGTQRQMIVKEIKA
jgi:hypothetical protein